MDNNKDDIMTYDEIKDLILQTIDEMLNSGARARGYENILTCVSYRGEAPLADLYAETFRQEGNAAYEWRSSVYSYCYAQLALIETGKRAVPTIEELKSEMPSANWP